MIPNKWGVIRNKDLNLAALDMFDSLSTFNLSEYNIEEVPIEYFDGGYFTTQGTLINEPNYEYGLGDVSKYDYIFVPVAGRYTIETNSPASGVTSVSGTTSNVFSSLIMCRNTLTTTAFICAYGSMRITPDAPYVRVSIRKAVGKKYPVIGLKRHRTDNVNPLGVIQPLNPGILQPGSMSTQEEEQEET